MKTEEKIRDILNRHYGHEVMAGTDLWFTKQYQDRYAHLLEMAEWKDTQFAKEKNELTKKANESVNQSFENGAQWAKQQMIEKACEWLDLNMQCGVHPQSSKGISDAKNELEKQSEQKPAWSEEDERYLNTTIAYLKDAKEFKKTAENCINWLKSLKDRVWLQPKQGNNNSTSPEELVEKSISKCDEMQAKLDNMKENIINLKKKIKKLKNLI